LVIAADSKKMRHATGLTLLVRKSEAADNACGVQLAAPAGSKEANSRLLHSDGDDGWLCQRVTSAPAMPQR
jgi:hypothetical protein